MTTPHAPELPPASTGREVVVANSAPGALAVMNTQATRLHWWTVARRPEPRPRRQIRLWIPVTPFLLLLSPLIFLIMGIAVLLPRPFGLNPAMAVLGIGRLLVALSGTEVDVDTRSSHVRLKIF